MMVLRRVPELDALGEAKETPSPTTLHVGHGADSATCLPNVAPTGEGLGHPGDV